MEDAKWFVVHTYSGYEQKVADNIVKVVNNRKMQDQILDVMIPLEIVEEVGPKPKRKPKSKKSVDDFDSWETEPIYDSYTEEYDSKHEKKEESSKKEEDSKKDKDAKKDPPKRKKYPGYVFVKMGVSYDSKSGEMKMTDEAWYVVRNTRGVTGFVGPESKPRPLSDAEVISMGVETHTIEVNYNVGDYVTIIGGPFDNFKGYVEEIDVKNDFVRVIISMMGRDTPIELGLDQVEPEID